MKGDRKGGVIEHVTTVGNRSSVLLGTLGARVEHTLRIIPPSHKGRFGNQKDS